MTEEKRDSIEVRPMRDPDIPRISEILRGCYRFLGDEEGFTEEQVDWLHENRAAEDVVRLESESQMYFVALAGDRIIGMSAIQESLLSRLYVDPADHGSGAGTTLLVAALETIRSSGFDEAVLGTTSSARSFYEERGFTLTGTKRSERPLFTDHVIYLYRKMLRD